MHYTLVNLLPLSQCPPFTLAQIHGDYHCLSIHHSYLHSSTDSVSKDALIPHSTLGLGLRTAQNQSGSKEPWPKSQRPLPRCMTLF